jgi:hypothetical protein
MGCEKVSMLTASKEASMALSDELEALACGNCGGTGWMVRDPDIGTDQECFVCDGSGRYSESATPQPTQAQVGAVPLDEARRLFDAGWKAAALFCDREDVVADGIIGFGACPQFEAAFAAAHGIKGGQHGTE